ncbi:MAG: hypothetical protein ACT4P6_19200 [Gemmatimonadaceae bacterium]
MDPVLVVVRLLHVGLGVFWAGSVFFTAFFLAPALRDAGPDGAKVAAGLMRRRMFDVIPIVASLTIISGLWLYWEASLGFHPEYMGSSVGITYGIGALAAIFALALGLVFVRPAMLEAARLTQSAASAAGAARDAQLAAAQQARVRGALFTQVVTLLVGIAVATMAVGRYM